jgi:hypothetical protein
VATCTPGHSSNNRWDLGSLKYALQKFGVDPNDVPDIELTGLVIGLDAAKEAGRLSDQFVDYMKRLIAEVRRRRGAT